VLLQYLKAAKGRISFFFLPLKERNPIIMFLTFSRILRSEQRQFCQTAAVLPVISGTKWRSFLEMAPVLWNIET
jgi:hypothetical protein